MITSLEQPKLELTESQRNHRLLDPVQENWKRLYRLRHELDLLLDELRQEAIRLKNRP